MAYVGIDLHKKESQICLVTETGDVTASSACSLLEGAVATAGGNRPVSPRRNRPRRRALG
jgi:hypothetical protein